LPRNSAKFEQLAVDTSHEYELAIFGRINSWDTKQVAMNTAVQLSPVIPVSDAGGPTLALLGFALGALVSLRRKL
jgi:hypothetical protein